MRKGKLETKQIHIYELELNGVTYLVNMLDVNHEKKVITMGYFESAKTPPVKVVREECDGMSIENACYSTGIQDGSFVVIKKAGGSKVVAIFKAFDGGSIEVYAVMGTSKEIYPGPTCVFVQKNETVDLASKTDIDEFHATFKSLYGMTWDQAKKEFVKLTAFKPGDFVLFEDGGIGILHNQMPNGCWNTHIKISYHGDKKTELSIGETPVAMAGPSQQVDIEKALYMLGKVWVKEANMVELNCKPGDCVLDCVGRVHILESKVAPGNWWSCVSMLENKLRYENDPVHPVSFATDALKDYMLNRIKDDGRIWDEKKFEFVKKRWRAKNKEMYLFVEPDGSVDFDCDYRTPADGSRWRAGNYFHPEEEKDLAEKYAENHRNLFGSRV